MTTANELELPLHKRIKWDNIDDKVSLKFELIQKMGRGNYGTVWKAIDKRDRSRIAIKKINSVFHNMIDAQRTLREIQILKDISSHPNIMEIKNVKIGTNHKDVYLFLELVEVDLLTLIRSQFCNESQRVYITW